MIDLIYQATFLLCFVIVSFGVSMFVQGPVMSKRADGLEFSFFIRCLGMFVCSFFIMLIIWIYQSALITPAILAICGVIFVLFAVGNVIYYRYMRKQDMSDLEEE